jgi:MFS family permease
MTSPAAVERRSLQQAFLASLSGAALGWYDFAAYSVAAATLFGDLFFPSADKVASTLAPFSTYAAGYLARPIGGFVFGRLGDVIGRKRVLVFTLLLTGTATFLIGVSDLREHRRLRRGAAGGAALRTRGRHRRGVGRRRPALQRVRRSP